MKRTVLFILLLIAAGALLLTSCQSTAVTSAKVYMQQSNWDKAIEQCKLAVEMNPSDAEAYFVMGEAYNKKKMYLEANDALVKCSKLSPTPARAAEIKNLRDNIWVSLFNQGVNHIKAGKIDDAVKSFDEAIAVEPQKLEAYKNKAYAYSQARNDSMAIVTYKSALAVDSTDNEILNFLGTLYYRTQKYDLAIETLQKVINNSDPGDKLYSEALLTIAYAYDLSGDSDKALATYESALEKDPNNKDLWFNLARLLFMQEKYDEAIDGFKKVLESDPNDFDTYMNIGNAYLKLEKFDEAVPYYEKAIELQPDNPNAWNNAGIAYVRSGQADKGKEAFAKADELSKESE